MLIRLRIRIRRFILFVHDLQEIPRPRPKIGDLRCLKAGPGDLERLRDYEDEIFTREQIREKLAAGETLYLIYAGEELAWLGWSRSRRFLHVPFDQWVEIPPEMVELYGVYTKPDFRNLGLARAGYAFMLEDLQSRGFLRVILQVETKNTASLHSVAAAGFRSYARLTYLRLGWPRFYWFADLQRRRSLVVRFSKSPSATFDAKFAAPMQAV
jgi:ribosomal protein S18 acetylase RimI-like enzyme